MFAIDRQRSSLERRIGRFFSGEEIIDARKDYSRYNGIIVSRSVLYVSGAS
jgi:hypothetical protein